MCAHMQPPLYNLRTDSSVVARTTPFPWCVFARSQGFLCNQTTSIVFLKDDDFLQACFEFIFQNFAFFFQSQPQSLGPSLWEEAVGFYSEGDLFWNRRSSGWKEADPDCRLLWSGLGFVWLNWTVFLDVTADSWSLLKKRLLELRTISVLFSPAMITGQDRRHFLMIKMCLDAGLSPQCKHKLSIIDHCDTIIFFLFFFKKRINICKLNYMSFTVKTVTKYGSDLSLFCPLMHNQQISP